MFAAYNELTGENWIRSRNKRLFDAAVATALLPIALPASAIGASAFFAESRVNPFLYQKRQGKGNQPLRIIKLRTMPFNYDFSDSSTGHADVRASRVGKILRKSTIDEFPQVAHILLGHMSIVGPRPLVQSDVEHTMDLLSPSEQQDWLRARSVAKPGWLSDFANMSRQLEAKTDNYFLKRYESDCKYLEIGSFDTDLRIIQVALGVGTAMIKE